MRQVDEVMKQFVADRLEVVEGRYVLFDDLQQEISTEYGAGYPEMVYSLMLYLHDLHHRRVALVPGVLRPKNSWLLSIQSDYHSGLDSNDFCTLNENKCVIYVSNLRWKS